MGSLKRNQKFRLSYNLLLNSRTLRVKDQFQEVESDKESELQSSLKCIDDEESSPSGDTSQYSTKMCFLLFYSIVDLIGQGSRLMT